MFKYGQEVLVTNGVYKGYRGIVEKQEGNEVQVVMYHPVYLSLTFEAWELE